MGSRPAAAVVLALVLAAGCVEPEGEGDGTGTPSPSRSATTSSSASITSTTSPTGGGGWTDGDWEEPPCPARTPIMAPYFFSDVAVRNGTGIVVLRNGPAGSYARHAEGGSGTRFLAAAAGSVYAAADADTPQGAIVQYDAQLNEVRRATVGPVGSLEVAGDTLYVGGLGRLTTLGLDLSPRDVLEFHDQAPKRIDYILVHSESATRRMAYLVDDVVIPFLVYKVDASDVRDLREAANHTIHSGGSPGPQWLDPAGGWWYVETAFSGLTPQGVQSSERAHQVPLDGRTHASVPLYSTTPTESRGFSTKATLGLLPAWSVLERPGQRLLAQVDFDDGVPSRACALALPATGAAPAFLDMDGPWLVATSGDRLFYVDPSRIEDGRPTVAREQALGFAAAGLAVLA